MPRKKATKKPERVNFDNLLKELQKSQKQQKLEESEEKVTERGGRKRRVIF